MDQARQIKLLQLTYAAQLADSLRQYDRAGILEQVTEERRAGRGAAGAAQAAQLGVTEPAAAFTTSAELFGCADWTIRPDEAIAAGDEAVAAGEAAGASPSPSSSATSAAAFTAVADHCLLCAMAKKAGAASPCRLFCLDPIEAMVRGLAPDACFEIEETLYDGERCRVTVRP